MTAGVLAHTSTHAVVSLEGGSQLVPWGEDVKAPKPWDRLLAHKGEHGRLLLRGLPYVDGFCVTPTVWRRLHPSHEVPEKHKAQTPEQDAITVDAFHPETVAQAANVRKSVQTASEFLSNCW